MHSLLLWIYALTSHEPLPFCSNNTNSVAPAATGGNGSSSINSDFVSFTAEMASNAPLLSLLLAFPNLLRRAQFEAGFSRSHAAYATSAAGTGSASSSSSTGTTGAVSVLIPPYSCDVNSHMRHQLLVALAAGAVTAAELAVCYTAFRTHCTEKFRGNANTGTDTCAGTSNESVSPTDQALLSSMSISACDMICALLPLAE